MKELKWKKEKTLDDIKREQVLRDHAVFNFGKKKEEFVKFLAQSSSANQVNLIHGLIAPNQRITYDCIFISVSIQSFGFYG